jgi:hypothetical protein
MTSFTIPISLRSGEYRIMISQILISLGVILIIVGGIYYSITGARLPFVIRIKRLTWFLVLFALTLVLVVIIEKPNDTIAIASTIIILASAIGLFVSLEWLKYFLRNRRK